MSEKLEVYDLKGKLIGIEDRSKYYKKIKEEFAKKGKINTQVKRVILLLMNSKGRIYFQERSKTKNENPNMYDKTIGGHVPKDNTEDMTLVKECAEELGFPASLLSTDEFNKAIKNTDLSIVGIFKKIDSVSNNISIRITKKGDKFLQPYISTMYIGYFDGPIRFVDGESSGIKVYSLNDLKQEMKEYPNKFTEDIKFMVKKYEKYLKPIEK
jgi:isopentenyldiphosphate isomerase